MALLHHAFSCERQYDREHHGDRRDRVDLGQTLSGWQVWPGYGSVPGMTTSPNPYRCFRYPAEVSEHAVRLYHPFKLNLRDVETILAARGVVVSSLSIRSGACASAGCSPTP